MCEDYNPCIPQSPKLRVKKKVFNLLLLDCWQREYDKRPYRNFVFKLLDFEERLERKFHALKDFEIIAEFLHKRKLDTVCIVGVNATTNLSVEKSFASGLYNLRRLELRMMQLPDNFFDQLVSHCDRMHLQELILTGTILSNNAIVDLRRFLIESRFLYHFNVADCNVSQYNFAILADGVHKSKTMRHFNFNRLIGDSLSLDTHKISHTVSSLIWQNKLVELEMQLCDFIAHDMEIVCEYLYSTCSKLRKLDVAGNVIATDGAEYIFRAIQKSGTLTHLNLSGCSLGTHGGLVVAHYLSTCFHLEHLNVTFNDIGAEAMNCILTMMKKRIKELMLKIWGNQFDRKSGKTLNRLLKARVVPQSAIDVTVTYDEDDEFFRIVPYY